MSDLFILRVIAEAACERLMQQIDQLKADVENVTNDNIRLSQENGGLRGERDRLKAEVERLRKAGDELAKNLDWSWSGSVNDSAKAEEAWNAAKEGKQS